VKKVTEYGSQQKGIEFIDMLFDVNKNTASYREIVYMFREYMCIEEAWGRTELLFDKIGRDRLVEISKEELKELCINDKGVCEMFSRLMTK
jgi:hypothetical protein